MTTKPAPPIAVTSELRDVARWVSADFCHGDGGDADRAVAAIAAQGAVEELRRAREWCGNDLNAQRRIDKRIAQLTEWIESL